MLNTLEGCTNTNAIDGDDIINTEEITSIKEPAVVESVVTSPAITELKTKGEEVPVALSSSKNKEDLLTDEEFSSMFNITRLEFVALPKWKRDNLKKKLNLF